jgi:glucose/arabinose dehydrogenase/PKD repeat protein
VRFSKLTALAVAAATVAGAPNAAAATYPPDFEEEPIVQGLTQPTMVAWAPDGRMFIAEKQGVLKVVAPGASTATVVADYSARVNHSHDRGLLGLAVDTQFAQNGYLYLLYTYDLNQIGTRDSSSPMASQLLRVRVSPSNVVTEATVILGTYVDGPCPTARNDLDCIPADGRSHSIGTVRSAPDGTLWVGNGDAADFGRVDLLALRAYDESSMAGKLFHIDRNGQGLPGHPFCPSNNTLSDVCTKLHSKGFRNPFRFTLRPGGGITVGDVGWESREEIDLIGVGGKSYGWPCYEGRIQTPGYKDLSQCIAEYAKPPGTHLGPDHEYPHGGSLSVLGGPTYTGSDYGSDYPNSIFFGDYSGGFIKRLVPNGAGGHTLRDFASAWTGTAIELGPDGNLTYVSVGNFGEGEGSVRRIARRPNLSPVAQIRPTSPTSGPAPLTVSFDGTSTDPEGDPLTYDWDFGDGSAHGSGLTISHAFGFGTYTVRLTVSDDHGNSDADTTTVNAGNAPPEITIEGDSTYRGGEPFNLSGSATDEQDGNVPAANLEWDVRLIHAEHTHIGGAGNYPGVAEIEISAATDHDADSHYEVSLSATDSNGATATKTKRLDPETATVYLRSSPSGAPLSYGGRQLTAPRDLTTAVGFRTSLSAPESFEQNGSIFNFGGWSDGGARVHEFTVPPGGGTLTATFGELAGQTPGGSVPAGGGPGAGSQADTTGPTLRLTRVRPKRGRLRGSALDAGGVRLVQVALRRRTEAGCRWWIPRLERMGVGPRSCARPRWLAAELTTTNAGARWLAKLGGSLPPGTYRVILRAIDNAGNESRLGSGPSTLVRVER